MLTAAPLKQRLQSLGEGGGCNFGTRLHRAISWLVRSEQETDDLDARFVFQWVALTAAYAREFSCEENERARFQRFVLTLVQLDVARSLHEILFRQFSGPIRLLVDNSYVFEPFWTALRIHDSSHHWENAFSASKCLAMHAITGGDTATVLSVVFDRLYVLRNQLVHGGATWNSHVNREQLRDGIAILGALVPQVIALMLDHPAHDFGDVLYPVV